MNSYRPPNKEHIDNHMMKMEVNLDDISGEWLGYVMDMLFNAGANDVFYTPIYMKKIDQAYYCNCFAAKRQLKR